MEKVDFELGFERALGLGGWGAFWGMRDWIECIIQVGAKDEGCRTVAGKLEEPTKP